MRAHRACGLWLSPICGLALIDRGRYFARPSAPPILRQALPPSFRGNPSAHGTHQTGVIRTWFGLSVASTPRQGAVYRPTALPRTTEAYLTLVVGKSI